MIDFISNIIFGFDYPGLQKALDPITLALLASQGIQYAGKAIAAKQQEAQAQKQLSQGKAQYDKLVEEFRSGKYDASVSQDVRDVAEAQRIGAEQLADRQRMRAEQQIQSSLAAARYGDPRAAALIPGQTRQLDDAVKQTEAQALQSKIAADASVAQAEQAVQDKNLSMQQQLASMEMRRGAAQMDAGTLAAQQAQQARIDALTGLASTATQGVVASDPLGAMRSNQSARRLALPENQRGELLARDSGQDLVDTLGVLGGQVPLEERGLFLPPNMRSGGQYKFANNGTDVQMTEGQFDHGTNKKALIDEETGEKEAELTGDEAMVADGDNMLVFNPEQQNTIEGLVNDGDEKGLMKKMKALLKKFNKENV